MGSDRPLHWFVGRLEWCIRTPSPGNRGWMSPRPVAWLGTRPWQHRYRYEPPGRAANTTLGLVSFNLFCTSPASSHLLSPIDRSVPPGLLSPWSFYRRGGCNVEGPLQSNHAVVRAPNLSGGTHLDRSHGQYGLALAAGQKPTACRVRL